MVGQKAAYELAGFRKRVPQWEVELIKPDRAKGKYRVFRDLRRNQLLGYSCCVLSETRNRLGLVRLLIATGWCLAAISPVPAQSASKWFAPTLTLGPAMASPRAPAMSLAFKFSRSADTFLGALGKRVPTFDWQNGRFLIQVGVDAGSWIQLTRDGLYFQLDSNDYLLGVPTVVRYGPWALEISVAHISAHLGDGAIEREMKERIKYTREFVSFRGAYDWRGSGETLARLYGGASYIFHLLPVDLGRFSASAGVEVVGTKVASFIRPVFAMEMSYNQDTRSYDLAGQLGFLFKANDFFDTRLVLDAYYGADRRGQFVGEREERIGLAWVLQ